MFLARRPQSKPAVVLYGPFGFSVGPIEERTLRPVDVAEGYDRHFEMVLEASGTRPKWWGQKVNDRSGHNIEGWKFWIERGGKRTPFVPKDSKLWTTNWDAAHERYFNEFFLSTGPLPKDASLKVSGQANVHFAGGPAYRQTIQFQATLKKVEQSWAAPRVSTATHMVIRKIEILRPHGGQTVALVTVFVPPGTNIDNSSLYMPNILTADWRPISSYVYGVSFAGGSGFAPKSPSPRIRTFDFQWPAESVRRAPERDLIVTGRYSVASSWPLEIAFPVKKDGKPLFGVVAPVTRPTGTGK